VLLGVAGCTGGGLLRSAPPSPHEQYRDMLRRAGLDQTALGQAWTAASDHALAAPVDAAASAAAAVRPARTQSSFWPNTARFDECPGVIFFSG